MLAATMNRVDPDDPLAGLQVGEHPEPTAPEGWSVVTVRAASLNHHDIWSLRGHGPRNAPLPRVLGSDVAGVDESGNEVLIHSLINDPAWTGDEVLDPRISMLSDFHDGGLAERIAVPTRNLVPKPAGLSFEHAACLPTAWLTAYRMLFVLAGATAGTTVLMQGAGGGVATAVIMLGKAAGVRVWVTGRSEEKRERAVALGAAAAFPPGARLPERVDAVIETVGAATWAHSMKAVRAGGIIVVAGMTSGSHPPLDIERVYLANLRIVGTTMGSRHDLEQLVRLVVDQNLRPPIHEVIPLAETQAGFQAMLAGDLFGKLVARP
ncbi:zinc-binding dehydrogenase [Pseudofrankia inefficax]|uniref:Alcohol dehydrogenase zinc-binding domain protein n=1 Tax=Pseudofrankia inefficax (strain DSM 45817 / CECT 9037 / DDB 130130 / EuI1c) TaxID=298654 RepID=E3J9G7_PSEI1|nr:zinc-binding dehydrogenase [Pseudofrankia inefficax]ADP83331.1 Alcohol dehydrogenase zinc-binding domain protein [Pseudofrankia inefficax]